MSGNLQPLDEKFAIVGPDGRPTLYFIQWAQQKQIDIEGSITSEQFNTLLVQYLLDHQLQEGSGIQITPDGNLSNNPTIAADAQEILDQITSTQGSIIYRNAFDWVALAPGIAGYFLKTNGAGANPEWAAGGGGGGLTPPTMVQLVANRAGGTFSLPATPTVGNLMVIIATGFTSISAYALAGFTLVGQFQNGANNFVSCYSRKVQTGDTGSYTIGTSNDRQAVLYEFSGAGGVASNVGGSMAGFYTGANFSLPVPFQAFSYNAGIHLLAMETDNSQAYAVTAETGWTEDYFTPGGTAGNHYASLGRLAPTFDGVLAGSNAGAILTPVYGSYVVTGS